MQLGFVSAILPELSVQEVFAVGSELGYDCIELMCWPKGRAERRYAGVSHLDVDQSNDENADLLRTLTAKHNVSVSGLGYYPNALSPDHNEATRAVEHIKKVIIACAQLNIRKMNTFIGRDWQRSLEQNWSRFKETWKPIIELAEQHGVYVGIENCPMLFTHDEWPGGKNLAVSPAIWRRMFDEIPSSHFGLNYDPSHLVWQQMDPIRPLVEFSDRIFHVHAKDVRIDRHRLNDVGILTTPLEYHTPKLPGLGDVDWGHFFAVLGDLSYRGPVCVEVEDRAYEHSLESRKSALVQCATFLRNYIP